MSSRSTSPASSLDFVYSDYSSEDESRGPARRRAKPVKAGKTGIKINLSALQRAATAHPQAGQFDGGHGDDDVTFLESLGARAMDLSDEVLKPDHAARPLWIDDGGNIILEAFAPLAPAAQDFLIAIAEPVSRPSLMHEYLITKPSLHSAMSVGLETNDVIEVLSRLSKIPLSRELIRDIREWTASYGKIKLVLKHNKYFLESKVPEYLHQLLNDEVIKTCVVHDDVEPNQVQARIGEEGVAGTDGVPKGGDSGISEIRDRIRDDVVGTVIGINETDELPEDVESMPPIHIAAERMEDVRKRCKAIDLPALEEYDFRNDTINPNLDIQLKPMTVHRPYQETALSKMFGDGRARSGIIVLPCGAGKTLVGITAATTIQKSTLVLCTSAVSVAQWKQQFLQFSNISERNICAFTRHSKEMFQGPAGVVVSTYSMIAKTGKRAHDAQKVMDWMEKQEWGFLLLDEVHVVPADMFRKCISNFKVHAKLGLTATLVREDDKIGDLNFLVGPKLYEANWQDLAKDGHIATVQCAEVWCPMTPEFYREYLNRGSRHRRLIHAMNPFKIQACQFLINYHETRGDKIIVFSDNVYALKAYAIKLQKPFIHGGTPEGERLQILGQFQHNPAINTIFLSKVGDTSIDLPEATCLIQISSHFGSRRQEAQRLGRILRAKRRNDEGFNAFFYSLVSKDTEEMYFSSKRQGFLIDQGYAFKVITELHGIDKMEGLVFAKKEEQLSLLEEVLNASPDSFETSDDYVRSHQGQRMKKVAGKQPKRITTAAAKSTAPAQRFTAPLEHLSGGQHMSYKEQNKSVNKEMAREERANKKQRANNSGPSHAIFRKRQNEIAAAKKRLQE